MGLLNNKLKDKKTIAVFFGLFIFITLISLGMLSQELNKRKIKNNGQKSFGLTEIPS